MPGKNNGTGAPLHAKCSHCRGLLLPRDCTGITKPYRRIGTVSRITHTARQYKCSKYGHIGFSAHSGLTRR